MSATNKIHCHLNCVVMLLYCHRSQLSIANVFCSLHATQRTVCWPVCVRVTVAVAQYHPTFGHCNIVRLTWSLSCNRCDQ